METMKTRLGVRLGLTSKEEFEPNQLLYMMKNSRCTN